jgi:adenosine deaminase CECR1
MCDTRRKMEEYEKKRQALVTEERGQRANGEGSLEAFDARVIAQASQKEKRAKKIVEEIKNGDIVVYKNDNKTVGDSFLKNVETIKRTELFKVARRMPKGAHLHCHFNTGLDPSFGIEQARGRSPLCIKSTLPLTTQENKDKSEITFQVYPVEDDNDKDTAKNKDIFSDSYNKDQKNNEWMRYEDFCHQFGGGQKACEKWLESKMVLTEKQVYGNQTLEG